jgi:hypothetical protein
VPNKWYSGIAEYNVIIYRTGAGTGTSVGRVGVGEEGLEDTDAAAAAGVARGVAGFEPPA